MYLKKISGRNDTLRIGFASLTFKKDLIYMFMLDVYCDTNLFALAIQMGLVLYLDLINIH